MKRIKRWFKRDKLIKELSLFLFIFPLFIGWIYTFNLPQVISVESGELLAYYGTVFGIFGSFIAYSSEKTRQKKERIQELKPLFFVEVTLTDASVGLFEIKIINHSEQLLSYMYFYDEFIETCPKDKYSFQVTYNNANEQEKTSKMFFNITMDSDIIDSDGYPKYVQILCDDKDGNTWNCCYYKVKDCEKVFYYPRDFEIL